MNGRVSIKKWSKKGGKKDERTMTVRALPGPEMGMSLVVGAIIYDVVI